VPCAPTDHGPASIALLFPLHDIILYGTGRGPTLRSASLYWYQKTKDLWSQTNGHSGNHRSKRVFIWRCRFLCPRAAAVAGSSRSAWEKKVLKFARKEQVALYDARSVAPNQLRRQTLHPEKRAASACHDFRICICE
jgi:hypothetical protein